MSDETKVECAWCGKTGEPAQECERCGGKAPVQERQYTLSEIRAGKAPKETSRYAGPGGDLISPKYRTDLPGSGGPATPDTN